MKIKDLVLPSFKKTVPVKEKKVFAAMCVHRGVQVRTLKMMRFFEKCPDPKIKFYIYEGDALIDRARGRAATDFMKSDCDILLFIDDDIFFYNEIQIRQLCDAAIYNDEIDIVGAAYSIKDDTKPVFAIRTLEDKGNYVFGKLGQIFEVRYISSGCMAVKRRVFQEMINAETVHLCNPDTLAFYPFFTPMETQLNGQWIYLSEDWSFCEKARNLGFKVWVDSTIKLGHIGPKVYDWDGFLNTEKKTAENITYQVNVLNQ